MNRRLLLATSAGIIGLSAVAHAQPVTGPYISLGGGGNYGQDQRLTDGSEFGTKLRYDVGEAGVAAIGYGFGNGFRIEAEGDYRNNKVREFASEFATSATGRRQAYGGMLNGYFDLDIGSPYVYPYFGVGAGYAQTRLENVSSTDPLSGYTVTTSGDHGNFAYQAMFGLSFPVAFVPGLSLTAEYRFYSVLDNGRYSDSVRYPACSGVCAEPFLPAVPARTGVASDYNHSVMIGLRYALFTPPAPVTVQQAVQTQAAAPVPEPARTYLVFFDWDRADLTARARQIVAEAAQASTHIQTTRIEVNGYTDLSGTAAYNQKLSVRRAQSVEAELVRDGVSAGEITIHGYGESNPLVQTAAGVREPQNRRVEIVIK
jgi:outer membrane protein OmpA-like peptidoglycan-associated protein